MAVEQEAAAWGDLLEGEEIAHVSTEPARGPRLVPVPEGLDARVRERLPHDALFSHQAEAWEAAERGEHVIVTTGTASGKTLAFNLPVLDALAREPKNRALYLYPTKALAQDQLRSLQELKAPGVRAAIYDGDTEGDRRWQIRRWANLVLTNPDMLHIGVLPHHDRWGDVLQNLRYVVVDEAHVYRGVFGSHVGQRPAAPQTRSPPCTAPIRSSCSRPRRSRTRPSSPSAWSASTRRWSRATGRREPSERSSSGTPSCSTRSSASERPRSATRRACSPTSRAAASARSASRRAARPPS